MNLHEEMVAIGEGACRAARELALMNAAAKNAVLASMARGIERGRAALARANELDVAEARQIGLAPAMIERLTLTDARIDGMIAGLRDVAALDDPVGRELERRTRPNGLVIVKRSVPIGVIGVIYESRPNVTADTAALCLKSGNASILRGGKESLRTNVAIADAMLQGGAEAGLPKHSMTLIRTTDRAAVTELVRLSGLVDLVIPRGGESLVRTVVKEARVPVIKHYKGVCHVYVDRSADLDMAMSIAENAKCQRPGVCNAMETLLVHQDVAEALLPRLGKQFSELGVELRGDARVRALVGAAKEASEEDWSREYLDLILSVRVVGSLDDAIAHINRYGSGHSDAIVAGDEKTQRAFTDRVDSAAVYVNASTRFTDGGEFGMGAELGISTDRIHVRGPMGLEGLTTYKYVIQGSGQVRT